MRLIHGIITTMQIQLLITFISLLLSCQSPDHMQSDQTQGNHLLITGIAQDAGYPQAGCTKTCCIDAFSSPEKRKHPVSLSIIGADDEWWMIECTPDVKYQIDMTMKHMEKATYVAPTGIFLTHAHIGHYAGLIHFGREVMGATKQVVYSLPRMKTFLTENGPWSQLVKLENIVLRDISFDRPVKLSNEISVTPIQVPHRDEFSETAGYLIQGPNKKVLFIPDIDKWTKWDQEINEWIEQVDFAILDATFYDQNELPGRDMNEIPHPFVVESIAHFSKLSNQDKNKVIFIHLNHSNDLIDEQSAATMEVIKQGFRVAREGQKINI